MWAGGGGGGSRTNRQKKRFKLIEQGWGFQEKLRLYNFPSGPTSSKGSNFFQGSPIAVSYGNLKNL